MSKKLFPPARLLLSQVRACPEGQILGTITFLTGLSLKSHGKHFWRRCWLVWQEVLARAGLDHRQTPLTPEMMLGENLVLGSITLDPLREAATDL